MTLLLQTKSLTTTTKKCVPLTLTTKVVFLSSTRWPLEIFFFGLWEELYTIFKLSQNTGTSGMYLIEVDAHQVDSLAVPIADQWNVGYLLLNILLVYTVCFHVNHHTVFTSLYTFWYTVIFHFRVPTTGEEIIVSLPT